MTLLLNKKNYKKITSGTKEWADYNVNCIKGCFNNCRYCYAKNMAKRFGRSTEKTWHNMQVNHLIVNQTFRNISGRIMFPSAHDIFEFPKIQKACFTVLEKLLKNKNEVLVTTKPRIKVIQKLDKRFKRFKKYIQFRFTITSNQNHLLQFWEPNAPLFEERFDSLKYAFKKGCKTSISIEPFLDYNPYHLVSLVEPYTTESIWIGKMNYIAKQNIKKRDKQYYKNIRKNYETNHLLEICNKLANHKLVRFKDSIRNQLRIRDNKM